MQSSEETSYIFRGILYYNEVSMCLQMLAPYLNILFPDFSGSWKLTISHVERRHGEPIPKRIKNLTSEDTAEYCDSQSSHTLFLRYK